MSPKAAFPFSAQPAHAEVRLQHSYRAFPAMLLPSLFVPLPRPWRCTCAIANVLSRLPFCEQLTATLYDYGGAELWNQMHNAGHQSVTLLGGASPSNALGAVCIVRVLAVQC